MRDGIPTIPVLDGCQDRGAAINPTSKLRVSPPLPPGRSGSYVKAGSLFPSGATRIIAACLTWVIPNCVSVV